MGRQTGRMSKFMPWVGIGERFSPMWTRPPELCREFIVRPVPSVRPCDIHA